MNPPPQPQYDDWIRHRLVVRRPMYVVPGEPGLLSFITTVWDTPLAYLRPAADSLLAAQTVGDFQWVVLDNGSADPAVVAYLRDVVAADPRVVYLRAEHNLGIIGGMRHVLAHATGRYVLPFDSDDLLYPDAAAILTHQIKANGYPPAMYSDEDKVDADTRRGTPYFKSDWDPVLLLNSCYVAHLGCLDRTLATDLGVYTDAACEGCHDWDAFTRFLAAGHRPVHVPEMLYSWRTHANSTAQNVASKSYVFDSQRAVLRRHLDGLPVADRFELQPSPLFPGTPDWWVRRRPDGVAPIPAILLSATGEQTPRPAGLDGGPQHTAGVQRVDAKSDVRLILPWLDAAAAELVCVTYDAVRLNQPQWQPEATGLFERFPDTVMVGGRVVTPAGQIIEAGRVAGQGGLYGAPDHGRAWADPGNLAEMWKQRSVGGVSTHLCVVRADFLRHVIRTFADGRPISWPFLGGWAALLAWRTGRRVIYTPFLVGVSDLNPDAAVGQPERQRFQTEAADFLPDHRYHSRHFSLAPGQAYGLTMPLYS